MTDLRNKCLIDKDTVKYLLQVIKVYCESYTYDEQKELVKALNQDLNGMVVVPVEPTEAVIEAGEEAYSEILKYLTENNIYHADKDKQIDYVFVAKSARYKAMIAAAPKLGK
jgi:hypothetical protein